MKLCERRCEACIDRAADGEPSAHFARVVWLCSEHSRQFHEAHHIARLRTMSTVDAHAAIDAWLELARSIDAMLLRGEWGPA